MNTIRCQRPITSIHSRKSSKSNHERNQSLKRRNSEEGLDRNDYDQSTRDKAVSISELMKCNRKNEIIKIDTIDEEPSND